MIKVIGDAEYNMMPCLGLEDRYLISDCGKVYSLRSKRFMKIHNDRKGYEVVGLSRDKVDFNKKVHRLVYEAFKGKIPDGLQINHINCIKDDNRLHNLEVVTPLENVRHALKNNLKPVMACENHASAKLKNKDVRVIKTLLKEGFRTKEIAKMFKVRDAYIRDIRGGRTWVNIETPATPSPQDYIGMRGVFYNNTGSITFGRLNAVFSEGINLYYTGDLDGDEQMYQYFIPCETTSTDVSDLTPNKCFTLGPNGVVTSE